MEKLRADLTKRPKRCAEVLITFCLLPLLSVNCFFILFEN